MIPAFTFSARMRRTSGGVREEGAWHGAAELLAAVKLCNLKCRS